MKCTTTFTIVAESEFHIDEVPGEHEDTAEANQIKQHCIQYNFNHEQHTQREIEILRQDSQKLQRSLRSGFDSNSVFMWHVSETQDFNSVRYRFRIRPIAIPFPIELDLHTCEI